KLTQLGLDISPDLCRELLTGILQRAQQLDNFVRVDMEGSAYTQRTLDLVLALHERFPNSGVVLQSYLYRTADDVARLNAAGVRIYVPYGTEWYPYLMRRLAERPANLLFIVRSLIRERRAA